jgi:hypothetical protein
MIPTNTDNQKNARLYGLGRQSSRGPQLRAVIHDHRIINGFRCYCAGRAGSTCLRCYATLSSLFSSYMQTVYRLPTGSAP